MLIFIKRIGFNDFATAEVSFRFSKRGYRIATLTNVTPVSKYQFYKQPEQQRFSLSTVKEGFEIHEIGMGGFFDRLEACYHG